MELELWTRTIEIKPHAALGSYRLMNITRTLSERAGVRVMLDLNFIDGDVLDTVSYISCVTNIFRRSGPTFSERTNRGMTDQERASAFREAVFESKRVFWTEHRPVSRCNNCGHQENLQVDHDNRSFSLILDTFLARLGMKLSDVKVIRKENVNYMCVDERIDMQGWFDFHEEHKDYILLCKSCNASKGSSGYVYRK